MCVICGAKENLEVHHIYSFAKYPKDRYDIANGITLCFDHHSIKANHSFHSIYTTHNFTPE
jgi:5-methylcytosine-specific restriction endonuclease McrA